MKIREFIAKYDRVLILVLTGLFCVLVFLTALAFSQRGQTQSLGNVLEPGLIGSQNHRLFARQNGGFFLVSEEETGSPVVTELNQAGDVIQSFRGLSDVDYSLEPSYPAFQRGGLLFVTDFFFQDEQSLDGWYALMTLDLESGTEPSTAYWKVSSEKVDFINDPISLTADRQANFYFVNPIQFGTLISFRSEDLENGNFTQSKEFSLGERYLTQIISTPEDGLYVMGQEWIGDDFRYAVWWMDPYADDVLPEETLTEVTTGESLETLLFPVDFVEERLAVCNDGKLYRIGDDHTFTALDWDTAGNGLEAVVSQTGSGTILVKSPDNKIKEYQLQASQPDRVVFDGQDGDIVTFASNRDDTMILLRYPDDAGYRRVLLSELTAPEPEEPSSTPTSTQTSVPTSSSSSSSDPTPSSSEVLSEPAEEDSENSSGTQQETPKEITSDQFMMIDSEYIVADVNTTWAKLRNSIPAGSGRLVCQRPNGTTHPGGKVGTGTRILLYDPQGKLVDSVTVVIPGDLNGSAAVNTQDERIMYQYLLGQQDLSGPYWQAADYDHDGIVDVLDLVHLKRFLE